MGAESLSEAATPEVGATPEAAAQETGATSKATTPETGTTSEEAAPERGVTSEVLWVRTPDQRKRVRKNRVFIRFRIIAVSFFDYFRPFPRIF